MSEKLTPQQKIAVENRGGNLLVSAAAGSGKTKVLVDRLMSYLTDPIDPSNVDDFLIITYTKAAASELRAKISDKLTDYIAAHPDNKHMHQQIQRLHMAKICTVHAFCADILREYAYRLDISADFRIAEESECQEIMLSVIQKLLDDAYSENLQEDAFFAFVDTQGLGRDDRQVPEIVLQIYASAMCHLNPDGWLDWCLESMDVDEINDAGKTIWGDYLIKDLFAYLSLQISTLERCISKIENIPGMEKPTALLRATVVSLRSLHSCETWDEFVDHPPVDFGRLTFTKEHKDTHLAEQVKAIRNTCKDSLSKKLRAFSSHSDTILAHLKESALAIEGLIQLVRSFQIQYAKTKSARRILDFTDIEQKMLDLLYGKSRHSFTVAAGEIGSRFREIMVDEYQDSNEVQDAIFSALTAKKQNCFMVGDVKQSIYQFRLADPGIFLDKYNTFRDAKTATERDGRKVLLSHNFRSSAGVISAVNDVFSVCMSRAVGGLDYGEAEMLREGIPHIAISDREVELHGIDVQEDTYGEEAAFVARRISELLDGKHMVRDADRLRPITADDIVILLRSPGSVGAEFQLALEQAGIPCHLGGDMNLLQELEVESLCSLLRIINNPLQDIPLVACLTSPIFGFTADELAQIRGNCRGSAFYHALEKSKLPKAEAFISRLTELRNAARQLTISQLIHYIFTKTGILSIFGAMGAGDEKVRNLQSFCQLASNFESTGYKDLTYFLAHLSSLEQNGVNISVAPPADTVRIMSIHKSKGLEFPVVFLCGLSRVFNMTDTQKQVLCHRSLGLGLVHTNADKRVRFPTIAKRAISAKIREESISEELRVLYVAMTRAKDRLIMTYAAAKLNEQLSDIALRLDMSDRDLMTSQVNCPGSWVLQAALQRTEAGAFFHLTDKPDCSCVREHPWTIQVVSAAEITVTANQDVAAEETVSEATLERMRSGLSFCYPHQLSTRIPSKLTATELKGRVKDHEAAGMADIAYRQPISFRDFAAAGGETRGTEFGNAVHRVMQHIRFTSCDREDKICAEIDRMILAGLLPKDQAKVIQAEKIAHFFQTHIGQKMIHSKDVLREFKFSILEDAEQYYAAACGEHILLQGVVDCVIIDKDGLTVVDFKTDYVTDHNRSEKIVVYTRQVQTYASALSKIYDLPVKASYLYFFSSEELVQI